MNFAWHMWHIIHTMFQKDSCSAHLWHLSTQCGPVNGMLETLTSSRLKTMPSLSTRFWVLDSDHGSVICSTLYTWSPATLFRVESKHIDIWWHLAHLALTLGRVWPSLAQFGPRFLWCATIFCGRAPTQHAEEEPWLISPKMFCRKIKALGPDCISYA